MASTYDNEVLLVDGRAPSADDLQVMKNRMSSEANKDIRDTYRNLLIDQQEKVDRAGEAGLPVKDLREMVITANENFGRVLRPREATLDAEYLRMCGLLVKSNIENKQFSTTEFHPTEFARKMIKFMHGEEEGEPNLSENNIWRRLGKAVSSIHTSAAPVESMYAGIDFEKPKKPARQMKKKTNEVVGAQVVPSQVKEPLSEEERQTEELNRVYKVLRRKFKENNLKPICFYSFVINPNSYCYTIENLFHTSFLVHMLRAEIKEDSNGLPVIIPREVDMSKSRERELQSAQCVISISTDEFKDLVKAFDLKESCIPAPQKSRKRQ